MLDTATQSKHASAAVLGINAPIGQARQALPARALKNPAVHGAQVGPVGVNQEGTVQMSARSGFGIWWLCKAHVTQTKQLQGRVQRFRCQASNQVVGIGLGVCGDRDIDARAILQKSARG